ncbi:MAG: aquaporin [Phycisphaerales bacterium]|nr:aquaporin [Phycisphaerales bacterium]
MNKLAVEFLGVFFLVLTIGMTVIAPGAGPMAPLAIASVLMVMVYAGGHVSGAHYNPAVTLGVHLRGKLSPSMIGPYMGAQLLGAVAAAALVLYFKSGSMIEPIQLNVLPAMLAECLFTFALVFVVLNVATAKATAGNSYYGVAIAFAVLAGALAVGGISGGGFNPAVSVGLCVMGLMKWADIWIHLVGQLAGAVLAAIAFKAIVKDPG